MPRDNQGNVFGHGSIMEDRTGFRFTVVGFATVSQGRIDLNALPKVFGKQYKYFRWTDVHNVNPSETSRAGLDTTDHCAVDRTQQAKGVLAASENDGDKVIWGS